MRLSEQMCSSPKTGDTPLSQEQAERMLAEVRNWTLANNTLAREFLCKNFREAMAFVNKVADVAEGQGHHPDIYISYKTVRLTLTTHKINGLSQNDFIMAARIDQLLETVAKS